jgi:hypothetical protein
MVVAIIRHRTAIMEILGSIYDSPKLLRIVTTSTRHKTAQIIPPSPSNKSVTKKTGF